VSANNAVFYGVGVGPGEFELLTLKAERILRQVDVICYPSCRPGGSSYALRIIKPILDLSRQHLEGLLFPMDKDFARLIPIWRESAGAIVAHLRANRSVAFITEGDPMLYSTFLHVYEIIGEEFPGVSVEIVPGVSSLGAAAAAGRIALGQGDEAIAIVPATYAKHELAQLLQRFDTVVLMKVGAVLDEVIDVLDELGLRDRALLASRVGTRQEIVTRELAAYRSKRLHYLTTLIVNRRGTPLVRALQEASERDRREHHCAAHQKGDAPAAKQCGRGREVKQRDTDGADDAARLELAKSAPKPGVERGAEPAR
jgi:precorrin-2/cobalt-factor-2 C20-methyltransferase